jgi:hypothetical protein
VFSSDVSHPLSLYINLRGRTNGFRRKAGHERRENPGFAHRKTVAPAARTIDGARAVPMPPVTSVGSAPRGARFFALTGLPERWTIRQGLCPRRILVSTRARRIPLRFGERRS